MKSFDTKLSSAEKKASINEAKSFFSQLDDIRAAQDSCAAEALNMLKNSIREAILDEEANVAKMMETFIFQDGEDNILRKSRRRIAAFHQFSTLLFEQGYDALCAAWEDEALIFQGRR